MASVPTYTYACRACGHRFDAVQSIAADPLSSCPECEGSLRRVIGSVGVTFRGSGFYRTDSRQEPRSSETSPSSTGGEKESASSEKTAKPAAAGSAES